ncbi:MAG: polysaccharide biosynthesis tyrosine autokinase [Rhodanobacteraceae bacterium]|nr:polysaccharide biosynthesis tyrosine autokinase [Rhodanobacteraceae bacterium]
MRDGNNHGAGRNQLPVAVPNNQGGALAPVSAVTPSTVLAELRQADAPTSDEINLLDYWNILVKRRWTVLGLMLILLFAAFINTLLTTPIFRAGATIQIDRETLNVVNVEGVTPQGATNDWEFYETQYQLLRSRSLAERVASQLHLGADPSMRQQAQPSPWTALFGSLFGGQKKPVSATATTAAAKVEDDRNYSGVISGGLSIEPVRDSRLVNIQFDSPDPQFAARVANSVAESFIATNLERRFDASSYAKGYLEDRLAQLKQKLEDSERELVAFAQKEQILSATSTQTLMEQNLGELNSAVGLAQGVRIRAEARWRQAQASIGAALPADMLDGSNIRPLQERRSTLKSTFQEKLRLYKPEYPEMKQLQAQISEIDRQITAELNSLKSSVKAEYDATLTQETLLREQLSELKAETLDLQSRSINYNILQREVATNRELYDGLLQRYKEIGVAGGVSSNNISIVDRAQVPGGPYKPDMRRNLLIGLLIGLFLGVLLALLLEYLDDTVKNPEDIEKKLRLVHLGVIPKLGKDITPAAALIDVRSGFAEAYRSVRTALQFSTESGVPSVLVITSTQPGEGKSTTAKSLARNFALLGKRVLLIDADLRNPSLHRVFELDNSMGLSNCLSGAAKPGQCIHRVDQAGISVMLSGPLPPNPAELLAGPRMISLLTQASERFDQIIIDAPPVLGLADAPILGNLAKGTLLVIEAGRTRVGAVNATIKRLLSARTRLLGAVLTKFDAKAAGYGYGYGGYGYNSYQYYSYGGSAPKKLTARREEH